MNGATTGRFGMMNNLDSRCRLPDNMFRPMQTGLAVTTVLALLVGSLSAQTVVSYNATNGQLTVDTTGGVDQAGFNLVSLKVPGPQATSIDRWLNGTSQDGVTDWVQQFTTNSVNGVTAEQWVALSSGGSSEPAAAVAPGVYQVATYSTGLTIDAFPGDSGAGIPAGQVEVGGWVNATSPGTTQYAEIVFTTGNSYPCDYVGDLGCDINDMDALYAGTNGAPTPLTDQAIATWLAQASDPQNPLKQSSNHVYVMGDINLDGSVGSIDLGILLNNFSDASGLGWGSGNLNSDASIGSIDLGLLLNRFGYASPPAAANSVVPEPAVGWMVWAACFGLSASAARRKRRKRSD